MNDFEPSKIWMATGALVSLILAGTAARVRPPADAAGIAQASALTPDLRTDSFAAGSPSATDMFDAYSYSFSQGSFSRGAIQGISLRSPHFVSSGNAAYSNDSQHPQLDVSQQIFGEETPQTEQDEFLSANNFANVAVSWFPIDAQAITAMADDGTIAWTYPVTADDTVGLGWQDGLPTAIDDPDFFVPHTPAISNVDVINIRDAQIESEIAIANGTVPVGWSESISNGANNLGRLLGSLSSGRISLEVVPQLIEPSEAGVDTYSTEALNEIRTKVIDAAIQQQIIDQVKAAQEEQAAFLQASAAYSNTIGQTYDDMSRIPW